MVDPLVAGSPVSDAQVVAACDGLLSEAGRLTEPGWGTSREMDQLLGALARAADDIAFLHIKLSEEEPDLISAIEHLDASSVALGEQVTQHADTVAARPPYSPLPHKAEEILSRAERELESDERGIGQLADKFDRYAYQQRAHPDYVRGWLLRHFGEIETRRHAQRTAIWATPEGGETTPERARIHAYLEQCATVLDAYNAGAAVFLAGAVSEEVAQQHMDSVNTALAGWKAEHEATGLDIGAMKAALPPTE